MLKKQNRPHIRAFQGGLAVTEDLRRVRVQQVQVAGVKASKQFDLDYREMEGRRRTCG